LRKRLAMSSTRGSTINRGEVTGVRDSHRAEDVFWRTAELVQIARPKMHIEETIARSLRWLLVMVVVSVAAGMGLALLRGIDPAEIAPLTVVLLGLRNSKLLLPTYVTISMALGSLELSRKGAIVTRLERGRAMQRPWISSGADKTGTITMNRLTLADTLPVGKHTKQEVVLTEP